MASEPFQDAAVLDQLLQQSLSPIANYGQGLLSLAIAKRQREQQMSDAQRAREQQLADAATRRAQQVEDITRSEAFTRDQSIIARSIQDRRDIDQRNFEREKIGLTNQSIIEREKELYKLANDEKQKELLADQKREAVANGLNLPENSTYEDYVRANANAAGEKITEAIKTVQRTSSVLAAARGQTREELRRDLMSRAIGTLDPKVKKKLTASQLNALINDPNEIVRLMDQAGRTNNRDLMASLADLNGQVQTSVSEMLTKAVGDKAMVQEIKDQNDTAQQVLQSLLKNGKYPPSAIVDAFKGYGQAAVGGPQASAGQTPQLPPLPQNFVSPPVAPPPPTPGEGAFPEQLGQNAYPNTLSAMRQETTDQLRAGRPVTDAFNQALGQEIGLTPQPIGSSVFTRSPGAQVASGVNDPKIKAALDAISNDKANTIASNVLRQVWESSPPNSPTRLRLLQFLDQSAKQRAALTPTAFPGAAPAPTQ